MKIIVLYKSKYGSSRQYALWLSEALQCPAKASKEIPPDKLMTYDIILYVGGLYAGGINGFRYITKHFDMLKNKELILCMVGMTDPASKELYHQVYEQNVPTEYRANIKPFALRGDQLFSQMSFLHRIMMKVPQAQIKKIPSEQRTEQQQSFLKSFGKDLRFTDKRYIKELLEYVHALQ